MPYNYEDNFQLRGLREQLVKTIEEKGISDPNVLEAVRNVQRHAFVESALAHQAYQDIALPIGNKQTISQPYTVAYQTQLLKVQAGDRVLEIGTGSGYQAAVLCEMGVKVFSIERHRELHRLAKQILHQLGYRPRMKVGDGTLGWPAHAPYQGIVVTAAGPEIPPPLKEQLAIGGRLVIPIGDKKNQDMVVVHRESEDNYSSTRLDGFRFVPLIGKEGWQN